MQVSQNVVRKFHSDPTFKPDKEKINSPIQFILVLMWGGGIQPRTQWLYSSWVRSGPW